MCFKLFFIISLKHILKNILIIKNFVNLVYLHSTQKELFKKIQRTLYQNKLISAQYNI